jgi:hypothetical protein
MIVDRFLIELPHDPDPEYCTAASKIFAETGSHYLTHADFGCEDGVHNAWIIVEAENHDEARLVVPPQWRQLAKVTRLKRLAMIEANSPPDR